MQGKANEEDIGGGNLGHCSAVEGRQAGGTQEPHPPRRAADDCITARASEHSPYFSIIIPVYNREMLIRRALDSCLRQDFEHFEAIVVDDASTDDTRGVVRSYTDGRIFLICKKLNSGVCPARNVGVDAARGEWLVFLDSDDELPAGALALMHAKTLEVGDDIAHLRFMCEWDNGEKTPIPPLKDEIWDYEGYVRFLERCAYGNTETMSCIRAATFRKVRFPDDRSYEGLYHLDFAFFFKTRCFPDVARLYHTDADNQFCFVPDTRHCLRVSPDAARSLESILVQHGEALKRWAPTVYKYHLRSAAKFYYLARRRLKASRYILAYLVRRPWCGVGWAIFILGSIGPCALAWCDGLKMSLRLRRMQIAR